MLKREEKRLAQGWVYEPVPFYEKNAAALALENKARRRPKIPIRRKRWVADAFYPVRLSNQIMKSKGR
jgi:hypothetical protein